MNYDFNPLKKKIKDVEEWLKKEHMQIRTGRATPALLDSVFVEVYGSKMPINQVASIAMEGPRSLRIVPWDMSQVKAIEKAITVANLGVSVSVDDGGARVSFPELTSETRTSILKIAKERLEQAKVSMKKLREETWADIQAKEKQGGMSEDEKFRFKNDMEKFVQEGNKSLDALQQKKEQEIMS